MLNKNLFALCCSVLLISCNSSLAQREFVRIPRTANALHPSIHFSPMATVSPIGYHPAQIRHAYGLDVYTNGGAGQVIAIVDAYGSPTIQADLNTFSATFGLPAATVTILKPAGNMAVDAGWALETSLDVEWVHAIAPKAKIILSEASAPSLNGLLAAVDAAVNAGATIVSMSWEGAEFSGESTLDSHFRKNGVSFFASSGDNGAGAGWPSVSPYVTAVGGTTLHLNAAGNLVSPEVGWAGSGGGYSAYYTRPTFQNGWQTTPSRAIPDVAMIADPNTGVSIYDSTSYSGQKGWFQVGGTSLSCPIWGAVVALGNERRAAARKATLSGATTPLYLIAGATSKTGPLYGYYFYDVTAGNNGGFSATPKFDEVTGLGTPVTQDLVLGLAAY